MGVSHFSLYGFQRFQGRDFRFPAFVAALVLYSLLGAPTPDEPGLVEGIIAALLIFTFLKSAVAMVLQNRPWALGVFVAVVFPAFVGVLLGNSAALILRDIVAFSFLLVPFLAVGIFQEQQQKRLFLYAFVFLGLAFSVRAILSENGIWAYDLAYFANSPAVLFAALYLFGLAYKEFLQARWRGVVAIVLSCLPLMVMMMSMQRASLLCVIVLASFLVVRLGWRRPLMGALVGLALCVLGVVFYDYWMVFYDVMAAKTRLYGGNMRLEEAAAVWNEVAVSPMKILFGTGWGGGFQSPAVADVRVNFTHNLFTSFLLKTGMIGLCSVVGLMIFFMKTLWRVLKINLLIGIALAMPLVIDMFLYASYKSLDFGLLLLLIVVIERQLRIESQVQDV